MTCHHEGQELQWEATVEMSADDFAYKYVVVNSEHKPVRQEQCKRKLQLPCTLLPHSLIELQDAWEVIALIIHVSLSLALLK